MKNDTRPEIKNKRSKINDPAAKHRQRDFKRNEKLQIFEIYFHWFTVKQQHEKVELVSAGMGESNLFQNQVRLLLEFLVRGEPTCFGYPFPQHKPTQDASGANQLLVFFVRGKPTWFGGGRRVPPPWKPT